MKGTDDNGKQLLESNGLLNLLKNGYDTESKLLLKEKEIYDKIVAERNNEINIWNNKIKYNKWKYYFKNDDRIPRSVNNFNRPLGLKRKIIDSSMKKAKEN